MADLEWCIPARSLIVGRTKARPRSTLRQSTNTHISSALPERHAAVQTVPHQPTVHPRGGQQFLENVETKAFHETPCVSDMPVHLVDIGETSGSLRLIGDPKALRRPPVALSPSQHSQRRNERSVRDTR